MGLRRDEFERMTIGEFSCRYAGFLRKEERRLDALRNVMWASIRPHSKRKITPKDLMELPMDNKKRKRKSELMTAERFNELKRLWLNAN